MYPFLMKHNGVGIQYEANWLFYCSLDLLFVVQYSIPFSQLPSLSTVVTEVNHEFIFRIMIQYVTIYNSPFNETT